MTSCVHPFPLQLLALSLAAAQNDKPFTSASIMSWQNSGHNRTPYNPGPTPQYAYPTGPDSSVVGYTGGFKAEGYDGGQRFEPKKKIRDPIFLVLFVAQVRRVPI